MDYKNTKYSFRKDYNKLPDLENSLNKKSQEIKKKRLRSSNTSPNHILYESEWKSASFYTGSTAYEAGAKATQLALYSDSVELELPSDYLPYIETAIILKIDDENINFTTLEDYQPMSYRGLLDITVNGTKIYDSTLSRIGGSPDSIGQRPAYFSQDTVDAGVIPSSHVKPVSYGQFTQNIDEVFTGELYLFSFTFTQPPPANEPGSWSNFVCTYFFSEGTDHSHYITFDEDGNITARGWKYDYTREYNEDLEQWVTVLVSEGAYTYSGTINRLYAQFEINGYGMYNGIWRIGNVGFTVEDLDDYNFTTFIRLYMTSSTANPVYFNTEGTDEYGRPEWGLLSIPPISASIPSGSASFNINYEQYVPDYKVTVDASSSKELVLTKQAEGGNQFNTYRFKESGFAILTGGANRSIIPLVNTEYNDSYSYTWNETEDRVDTIRTENHSENTIARYSLDTVNVTYKYIISAKPMLKYHELRNTKK